MDKKEKVIFYLNNQKDIINVKKIALDLDVSVRTIQNYIRQIKDEYPDSIETGQQGVKIVKKIILDENEGVPKNSSERETYILRSVLLNNEPKTIYEYSQFFCISYSTLQNEIIKIRKRIERFNLKLKTKDDILYITGSSEDRKSLISEMIYNESQNSLISLKSLNDIFPVYDVAQIRKMILAELGKKKLYIDEFSLVNLLLHILISMDQNTYNTVTNIKSNFESYNDLNHHFIEIIENICNQLEKDYNVIFMDQNKQQFILLLMTRAIKNISKNSESEIKELVENDKNDLLEEIIKNVNDIYSIDLNVSEFKVGFSLHIKNMLIRLNEEVHLHNPLLDNIKTTSPFIYDIAVYISNYIQDREKVKICEDEIAYIALHVGSRIEEIRALINKAKAVLICPQYYSYHNSQIRKIESLFRDDLAIMEIITNPDDLIDERNCDFIISTIPLVNKNNIVQISNFLNDNDKINIQNEIFRQKKNKKIINSRSLFQTIFIESLFEVGVVYENEIDAINKMGKRLIDLELTNEDYITKIFEREKISPTNFGKVAIPHPIDFYSKKTVFEVSILKEPILWGESEVSIVFMLVVSKEDYPYFQEIFSFLASVCMDSYNLEKIISCKNYNDFLKLMLVLYQGN